MKARRFFVACALFWGVGCASSPWVEHPMTATPDRSCRTGHEVGADVYIWECHEQRRVVVYQTCSALLGCDRAIRQTSECGDRTSIERELGDALNRCDPVPGPRAWPAGG
jgi:hypothetical protein